MNDWPLEFDKNPKVNAKWQLEQCEKLIENREKLKTKGIG